MASAQPVAESGWSARKVLRIGTAVICGGLLLAVAIGFATSKPVSDTSMRPTLRSGDRVLVDTSAYHKAAPGRFDVVALHAPGVAGLTFRRVIGLPGDRVQIRAIDGDAQLLVQSGGRGTWYAVVSRHRLSWGNQCCGPDGRASGNAAATVPAGEYFVLGDNPAASRDSRTFGFIPRSRIAGRVSLRVWPPGSVGGRPRLVSLAG